MKIFLLKQNKIELNTDEILLYKEFANIIKEFDEKAFDVFKYIYLYADSTSFPNKEGYNDEAKHKHALANSGLLEKDITLTVHEAIRKYLELNHSVIKNNVNNLIKTFQSNDKIISQLGSNLERKVESLSSFDDDEMDDEKYKSFMTRLNQIIEIQKQIFNIASAVPTHIKKLIELEKEINSTTDIATSRKASGGKEIPTSFDGDEIDN